MLTGITADKSNASIISAKFGDATEQSKGISFSTFLEKTERADADKTDSSEEALEDSAGIVLRQMLIAGEGRKSITHNGVNMSFEIKSKANGGYQNTITIGVETGHSKWYSVVTSAGIVKFDLNDMGSVLACMDMFSAEDARKIMEVIQMEKVANAIDEKIDNIVNEAVSDISEGAADNTQTAEDTAEGGEEAGAADTVAETAADTAVPSEEQLAGIFVDRGGASGQK